MGCVHFELGMPSSQISSLNWSHYWFWFNALCMWGMADFLSLSVWAIVTLNFSLSLVSTWESSWFKGNISFSWGFFKQALANFRHMLSLLSTKHSKLTEHFHRIYNHPVILFSRHSFVPFPGQLNCQMSGCCAIPDMIVPAQTWYRGCRWWWDPQQGH